MNFSVIITTHNRREDLIQTLKQIQKMRPSPAEILITADGCSDGTEDLVQNEFPDIRIFSNQPGKGSVASRDHMIRESHNRYILCLDDDSYPVEKDFFTRMETILRNSPDAGLVTFPQRSEEYPASLNRKDFGSPRWIGSYPNSGAVYDRELYLNLPGFPHFFFHAYEEPDYAIQVISAGKKVLFSTSATIRHHWAGTGRNEGRTHRRHARNEALSVILRAPQWAIPLLLPYRALRQFQYAWKRGFDWVIREPLWWWDFFKTVPIAMRNRKPVTWDAYYQWLVLLKNPKPI